jgi:hypothetical protein
MSSVVVSIRMNEKNSNGFNAYAAYCIQHVVLASFAVDAYDPGCAPTIRSYITHFSSCAIVQQLGDTLKKLWAEAAPRLLRLLLCLKA